MRHAHSIRSVGSSLVVAIFWLCGLVVPSGQLHAKTGWKPAALEVRGGADFGGNSVQSVEVALRHLVGGMIEPSWFPKGGFQFGIESRMGSLLRKGHASGLASIGPTLEVKTAAEIWFVRLGVAPTYLSHPAMDDFDMGGNLHFTTSVAVGRSIGDRSYALYHFQHISNGGIRMQNPGVDLHCVGVGLKF